MTDTTSTSPPRPHWTRLAAWGLAGALAWVAVFAALGGASLVAGLPALVRRAAGARLHLPDAHLFAAQPIALQIHIVALVVAVPLGFVMMASRKGRTFHRVAGWTWAGLVLVGSAALVWLALADGRWRPLHLLLIWVLPLLAAGLWFARRHQEARHRTSMRLLFYGSILFPGALTFTPGRLMWRLFFG